MDSSCAFSASGTKGFTASCIVVSWSSSGQGVDSVVTLEDDAWEALTDRPEGTRLKRSWKWSRLRADTSWAAPFGGSGQKGDVDGLHDVRSPDDCDDDGRTGRSPREDDELMGRQWQSRLGECTGPVLGQHEMVVKHVAAEVHEGEVGELIVRVVGDRLAQE